MNCAICSTDVVLIGEHAAWCPYCGALLLVKDGASWQQFWPQMLREVQAGWAKLDEDLMADNWTVGDLEKNLSQLERAAKKSPKPL